MLLLFGTLLLVRLVCLGIEFALLNSFQARFDELTVSNRVAPVSGGKAFGDLTNAEILNWLEDSGLEVFCEAFTRHKVTGGILNHKNITEEDVAGFGDFPPLSKRSLVAAIKAAIADGVGGSTEGLSSGVRQPETATLQTAATPSSSQPRAGARQQASNIADSAATVVSTVPLVFLAVSIFLALNSVGYALLLLSGSVV